VRLTRVLTQDLQRRLDPFLMLDVFGSDEASDYIGGFPDHPHRGFETITLMLEGRMRHRDSAGHEGLLGPGAVQWMTAGHGVIHSEMPEQEEGRMEGFQLWLNLPARDKLCPPDYRDFSAEEIPVALTEGVHARVIAGRLGGVRGAVQRPVTDPTLLHLQLAPGARLIVPLPATHHAFVHVHRGELALGPAGAADVVPAGRMAILETTPTADGVAMQAGDHGAQVLLVAGQPLNEPIAQWGPFVMNTQAELQQAVADFQSGVLGRHPAAAKPR
jgi:redox-sensitive bicupin YhaK (pirin superfamily)